MLEKTWNPTPEEAEQLQKDRLQIDEMYEYRAQEEEYWIRAAEKWNQINKVDKSMFIPFTRLVTQTGIIQMSQSMPKLGIIPEDKEDEKIVQIIKDCNDHYDRLNGMEEVWSQLMTDYAVLGNAVMEDFVQYAYTLKRTKVNGTWKTEYVRDFSKPKVATRARSPWECAFQPGSRTVSDIRACTFIDLLTFPVFLETYGHGKNDMYKNTDYVRDMMTFTFDDKLQPAYEKASKSGVVVEHFQDEEQDAYRIYANGVLIFDESLKGMYAHGKITLSLMTNHHTYDDNLQTHRLYGRGDPFLLEDLDDYLQAIFNQFIKNYEAKTTNIISIEGGGAIEDINIETNTIMQGKVNVQSLGQSDLGEFNEVKNIIEEMGIQHSKKNYKRLEGEVAKTAYEARQKQQAENAGIQYQLKKIENIGLRAHFQKRISNIMEYSTEEEIVDIADLNVQDAAEFQKLFKDHIRERRKGKPTKVAVREKFKTSGRSYDMTGKDRKTLKIVSESEDGMLYAYPDFLQTREYKLYKRIPEVYVVANSAIGEDKEYKYEQLQKAFQFSQAVAAAKIQFPDKEWDIYEEKAMEYSDINATDFEIEQDETVAENQKIADNILNVLKNKQRPQANPIALQQGGVQNLQQGAGGGLDRAAQVPSPTMAG